MVNRSIRHGLLALVVLAAPVRAGELAVASARATFTNPVVRSGADPWVVKRDGVYYFCQSRRGGIWVARSSRLEEIGRGPWRRVWTPEPGSPFSMDLWAPELHFLRGKWYIYVAADDGRNRNHRMIVLEATSTDPQGPFRFKGKLAAATDRWAIDGSVLALPDGRLYFIWSGWDGFEDVAQDLYIAPMSDPATISGERVCISRPEYPWERAGGPPVVNEAPTPLIRGGKVFLIYSAGGSWCDDYCLGRLTWNGGDPLDPWSWSKSPEPVFRRTDRVFGPGHASFTTSPDGRESWIVYHAAKRRWGGWERDVRIQPFRWNPDGTPDFGQPVAPGLPLAVPSGEPGSALGSVSDRRQENRVMATPSGSVSRDSR